MDHAAEFRRCLSDLDVGQARKLWAYVNPHLPQPENDAETLVMLHHARTQSRTIELRLRAYSHRWLLDNGYPSGLPDELKPKAERMYPRVVSGVGISVNARSAEMRPVAEAVHSAMSAAVEEAYADGENDPRIVRGLMADARRKTIAGLI